METDTAMGVTVRFFANVRQSMGKDEVILDLDPGKRYTIKDILREISRSENTDLSFILREVNGESRGAVRVVVNGKEIRSIEGSEASIKNGDRISIFPLLAGGQNWAVQGS
jgi:molybdopterin synthase sulfur carrier subunit